MNARGQAALEYLMTYGWALVVIVIVIAALFALGILNPTSYQGETCRGFSKLGYQDHVFDVDNNDFKLVISNGAGADINVLDMNVVLEGGSGYCDNDSINKKISAGSQETIDTDNCSGMDDAESGQPYKVTVTVKYKNLTSDVEHTETALCTGRYK